LSRYIRNIAGRSIIFVLLLLFDRTTKYWAEFSLPERGNVVFPSFALHYNNGISFSLLKNYPHVSLATAILGIFTLGFFCIKDAALRSLYGVTFLWAGALGNLADRLLYGYVVDWIYVGGFINAADIWLSIGGVLVLIYCVKINRSLK
jgi:signal peptidase II